jgi:hypothetical protein
MDIHQVLWHFYFLSKMFVGRLSIRHFLFQNALSLAKRKFMFSNMPFIYMQIFLLVFYSGMMITDNF